eukprot:7192483-Pyramimonas_sp.AAC.1
MRLVFPREPKDGHFHNLCKSFVSGSTPAKASTVCSRVSRTHLSRALGLSLLGKTPCIIQLTSSITKTQHFRKLWLPTPVDRSKTAELFRRVREVAEIERLPEISLEELDQALRRIKPKAGLGADGSTALDIQRLPVGGRQEFVDLLNSIGIGLTWPR